MDVFLGLDLGTTNCKVLAIDADGQLVASLSAPMPVMESPIQEAAAPEHDAMALWGVSARLVRQIVEGLASGQRVAGLAVTSMGEAGVLVDRDGEPLVPVITWHDRRTLSWVEWWRQRISEGQLYQITGLPLDHIYSANKLLWLRQKAPQAFTRAQTWLCLADWLTFCLTGHPTTSYSLASRTMLFDQRKRAWSRELLRLADLPGHLMPPAFPSSEVAGMVTSEAARLTGLQAGVPVIIGGHDHICAAVAAGAITPEVVLDSAGTAEALMVTLTAPLLDPGMAATGLCCGCHTARDRYYLLGGLLCGGVLAWVSRMLVADDSPEAIGRLMEDVASSPVGANGLWFMPHLQGSGPPQRDPSAWGAWLGLRLGHTRADLARAAVEGVSYAIRFMLEALLAKAGISARELRCVGGGTRSSYWQQVKADVMGIPIDAPAIAEVTAQGAALLAGIGVGAFVDEAEAAQKAYRSAVRYNPQPENTLRYEAAYRQTFLRINALYQDVPL